MRRPRLRGMQLAFAVCGAQLLLGLVLAAVFGWFYGARTAAAAVFGAVIAAVPGFYMALHLLPDRPSSGVPQQMRLLVLGQLGKLVLTGGLFVAAVLLFKRDFGPLLATYVACLACYWLALITIR